MYIVIDDSGRARVPQSPLSTNYSSQHRFYYLTNGRFLLKVHFQCPYPYFERRLKISFIAVERSTTGCLCRNFTPASFKIVLHSHSCFVGLTLL